MTFVSSKGNILCRLINIELYEIFPVINRAIKGLHCTCQLNVARQHHMASMAAVHENLSGGLQT